MFRPCYRQMASNRYVIISIIAISVVVFLTWSEEEYIFNARSESSVDLAKTRRGEVLLPSAGELLVLNDDVVSSDGATSDPDKLQSQNRQCPDKGQTSQVILLTYGRSGSSLTADILQRHDDVFFHYEPLHNLAKSFSRIQREYHKRYQKYLYLTAIHEYNSLAESVMELLLTCDYTHLIPEAYRNLHLIRSADTRPIHACIKQAGDDGERIKECLKVNAARCTRKPLQLIKTIRMAANSVGNLMAKMPNLKVIYLVRDPRGSYLSKLKAFPRDFSKNATFEAQRICPRYKKDIDGTFRLHHEYPNRVHITRYESIAEDPLETSRRLYDFLCLEFTPRIENSIIHKNMEGTNHTDKNIYAVRRQDSKAASYAWRSKMRIEHAVSFDEECSDVYDKLGYLPVDDEEHLRDLDSPLKVDLDSVT